MKDKLNPIIKEARVIREMLDRGLIEIPTLKLFLNKIEALSDLPASKKDKQNEAFLRHLENIRKRHVKTNSR